MFIKQKGFSVDMAYEVSIFEGIVKDSSFYMCNKFIEFLEMQEKEGLMAIVSQASECLEGHEVSSFHYAALDRETRAALKYEFKAPYTGAGPEPKAFVTAISFDQKAANTIADRVRELAEKKK